MTPVTDVNKQKRTYGFSSRINHLLGRSSSFKKVFVKYKNDNRRTELIKTVLIKVLSSDKKFCEINSKTQIDIIGVNIMKIKKLKFFGRLILNIFLPKSNITITVRGNKA